MTNPSVSVVGSFRQHYLQLPGGAAAQEQDIEGRPGSGAASPPPTATGWSRTGWPSASAAPPRAARSGRAGRVGSRGPCRHGRTASAASGPAGAARRKSRSRRWAAPTSDARRPSHVVSYRSVARSASTTSRPRLRRAATFSRKTRPGRSTPRLALGVGAGRAVPDGVVERDRGRPLRRAVGLEPVPEVVTVERARYCEYLVTIGCLR